jgi:predicted NBD/HSP70 family sugar kinase
VRFRDGVPVSPPLMPGWDGFAVRDLLAHAHECPVVVDNDVNIMAIGEGYRGVARSVADFLFVKVGSGIGCGVHLGGAMYRGNDGSAGDIGHIQIESNGPVCARDVGEAAAAGDAASIALIRDGGRRLGTLLAGLVSFANPSMIVIGGGLAQLGHRLLAEVRAAVYGRSLPLATGNLPIVLSELGGRAGVIGAGKLASDVVFRQS